ncbi:NAD(P)-dependent oxidoreductase [Polynucleobacter paneuropaeus]|nr:NAD(P)-dependent oxidoreductase [Polynucleobacter paneuropaeus]
MSELVLLTGATGFVGAQVLNSLHQSGKQVRLVLREGSGNKIPQYSCIESIVSSSDIFAENESWWEKVCEGVDTAIHVAWYAEPGDYLRSSKNLDCLMGTLAFAKGAAKAKIRRFVGIGTCFEYELSGGYLSIETQLNPLTPYAACKVSAYSVLSSFFSEQGIEFIWGRLFYLYGDGENPKRLVPYIRSKLQAGEIAELTSGAQIRDYLNVSEAGEMIVQAAFDATVGPINICSGVPITVRELAEKIADEYGGRELLKFGARADNLIDPPCVVGLT